VYSFDPVGSYEREACRAAGAAQSLVQPFLDNQVSAGVVVALLLPSTSAQLQLQLGSFRIRANTLS
jgi:20S proteasome alpha/beta subunit